MGYRPIRLFQDLLLGDNILYSLPLAMISTIDNKALVLLKLLLPDFNPVIQPVKSSEDNGVEIGKVDLPLGAGADYFFQLWSYGDCERQICARRVNSRSDDEYFWYRPLEMGEFAGSSQDLSDTFCEELEALLAHQTRIVQRKGWLFWHIRCEYYAGNAWKCISGQSAFRGGRFKPPQISGTVQTYQSGPIAKVKTQVSSIGN